MADFLGRDRVGEAMDHPNPTDPVPCLPAMPRGRPSSTSVHPVHPERVTALCAASREYRHWPPGASRPLLAGALHHDDVVTTATAPF